MRQVIVLAAFAVALVGVAGCGGTTVGRASPVVRTSPPTSSSTRDGLPVNQACSLLSSADFQQLGASSPPSQEMVGTAHACEFNSDEFALGVAIRTNVGLAGFVPLERAVHDTTIGRHQAREETSDGYSCDIAIGVSASSRVDIDVSGDGTTNPCPTALTLARMVERRLP